MAPKKSAFRMFMGEYNKNQIAQGKPPTSFKELPWILSPIWSVSNLSTLILCVLPLYILLF